MLVVVIVFALSDNDSRSNDMGSATADHYFSDEDVNHGVLCEINGIQSIAAHQDDCEKVDGTVTHGITLKKEAVN